MPAPTAIGIIGARTSGITIGGAGMAVLGSGSTTDSILETSIPTTPTIITLTTTIPVTTRILGRTIITSRFTTAPGRRILLSLRSRPIWAKLGYYKGAIDGLLRPHHPRCSRSVSSRPSTGHNGHSYGANVTVARSIACVAELTLQPGAFFQGPFLINLCKRARRESGSLCRLGRRDARRSEHSAGVG
jgi:hypothetical protein